MSEDKHILKQLQRGDKDALRLLYEKYADTLVSVAVTLVSDVQTAEDCLHDAFVDFAATVPVLHIHGNLRSYLISCVANRARDILRKRTRSANLNVEQLNLAANADEPSSRLITNEGARQVYDALGQLPYEQREVFVLHVQADMTFHQIAELVGASINTVQSRYRYGMEKLRSLLNTEFQNE
ncbi:MAG: RNA polymerase sigma factor [Sedimentisphaerales bacterium]|nr:RNA polymerase sigma factor [Sedimentisphaerales bacterium]